MNTMHELHLKRVYEPWSAGDGRRILVDRLWPRGLSKTEAHVDEWLRDIAPSPELRKWFCHRPERFLEFRRQYELELQNSPIHQASVQKVLTYLEQGDVTLL
jgi:uncharacterized protein YeaO (DUF488 family)